jgi:HSP20 family protein
MKSESAENEFSFSQNEGQLAVDCIETPREIIIRSAIAGVKLEDLHIHVTEDLVTIRGERSLASLPAHSTVHYSECFWGAFSRSIVLPCRVKTDEADAVLKNGILTITIPKAYGDIKLAVREDLNP